MSDFHQTGPIATLHRLGKPNLERLEMELTTFSKQCPIGLVLPCLFSELQGEALPGIIRELKNVPYLREIVVSLDGADEKEFDHGKNFFGELPQKVTVIWNNGPRMQALLELLKNNEVEIGQPGKGRSCWLSYGYILARGDCQVIAQHDCDIITYQREILARLCYPAVAPSFRYEYCKGYYARVTERLHGRVTRLFITPLIRTLQKFLGQIPLLTFLDSFRYPLSGEFSMVVDLAQINRVPGDWGLEIGTLAETYRNCAHRRICQTELCDAYEHKHQILSPEDPQKGLMKMSTDIAKSLFRNLAIEGVILDEGLFKNLGIAYLRSAQDTIKKYEDDAAINSFYFDRHEERLAVEAFTRAIKSAGEEYLADPVGVPLISNWVRPTSAIPNFFERLLKAVKKDNG
ncbi:MAG TPA: glycosyl transferase [Nitrospiria bacterium]